MNLINVPGERGEGQEEGGEVPGPDQAAQHQAQAGGQQVPYFLYLQSLYF